MNTGIDLNTIKNTLESLAKLGNNPHKTSFNNYFEATYKPPDRSTESLIDTDLLDKRQIIKPYQFEKTSHYQNRISRNHSNLSQNKTFQNQNSAFNFLDTYYDNEY